MKTIALLVSVIALSVTSLAAGLKVGDTLHGFKVKDRVELPDVGGRMWRMEYLRNGADLVWLERPDDNRTFAIAFRTIPEDDTGVAHIMEHSVLCGSEKYPVKEPFVELLKSSMSTFLNAMTGADATTYPVASKNGRDFLNLAGVYLDAVFHPLSVKDDWAMRQEGWHYECDGTNLTRNGIVYSEMKARFGDPEYVGYHKLIALLYPGNTYGKCSGGDPAHIPELTFAKYRAFHERFYHPSNSYIFLDGDIDLPATLALIDSYLAPYDRRPSLAAVVPQKPVANSATIRYESQEETRKTILWDGWVSGARPDWERMVTMDVLADVLADSNEAPLKRALLEAGLCEDVSFWCGGEQQLNAVIKVQNTDPDKADTCRRVIRDVLETACRKGLDAKRLAAVLDKREFRQREIANGQRGIHYLFTIRNDWMFGGDPAERLRTTELFAKLRQRIGTGWYERVLREATLDSPHHAALTMLPSKTLAAERRKAELAELERIKAGMSAAQLAETAAAAKRLKARQSAPDRAEDVAKLPRLSIRDVPPEGRLPRWTQSSVEGATVIRPEVAAGGIVYLEFCFSLAGLTDSELLDVPFLAQTLGKLATERFTALELRNELDGRLGRFSVGADSYTHGPQLIIHAAALDSRREDILRLAREVALTTRFDDAAALANLRRQRRDELERTARSWGGGFATACAQRGLGEANRVRELFGGISQLRRMQGSAGNDLSVLARRVFTRERLTVSLTGDLPDDFIHRAIRLWPVADRPVPDRPRATVRPTFASEGYEADGTVGFTTLATRLPQGVAFGGSQRVAARIISLDYLWQEIRVKGGAYGGGLGVGFDGDVVFNSWRDPNPARSFATFAGAGRALADFVRDGGSIEKYQVSALAKTEPALSPRQEVEQIRSLHFNGRTTADLQRLRREIIGTQPADLLAFAQTLTAITTNASKCAFAKRELLEPCKFDRIGQVGK